jgi:hypothetical protein
VEQRDECGFADSWVKTPATGTRLGGRLRGHGGPPTSPGREIAVVSPDCNRTGPTVFTAVREAAGCPRNV